MGRESQVSRSPSGRRPLAVVGAVGGRARAAVSCAGLAPLPQGKDQGGRDCRLDREMSAACPQKIKQEMKEIVAAHRKKRRFVGGGCERR